MRNKLLVSKQNDSLPDVVFIDPQWLPELVRLDILCILDTQHDYNEVTEQLLSGAIETGCRGVHFYGLPFSLTSQLFIYNPQIVTIPSLSFHQINNNSDIYSLGISEINTANIIPFLWNNGGELLNIELTKATGYFNSTNNINSVEMFINSYKENLIYDSTGDQNNLMEMFVSGKIGMIMGDTTFLQSLNERYPDFIFEVVHDFPDQKSETILNSTLLAIPNNENTEISWEIIKVLLSKEVQINFTGFNFIPANKEAMQSESFNTDEFSFYIESIQNARALPNVSSWNEMDNEFSIMMIIKLEGYISLEQGMNGLANTWDALLP